MIVLSFSDWYQAMVGYEKMFWLIAMISSAIFIVQVAMALIGFDAEAEGSFDMDGIDGGFTLISIRTILAFMVCFGWIGFMTFQSGAGLVMSLIWGALAGLGAMVIVAYLLYQLIKMNESGTIQIEKMINRTGEVYITIPAGREGRVSIEVEGKLMEFSATSDEDLATGSPVKVTAILEDNLLYVQSQNE